MTKIFSVKTVGLERWTIEKPIDIGFLFEIFWMSYWQFPPTMYWLQPLSAVLRGLRALEEAKTRRVGAPTGGWRTTSSETMFSRVATQWRGWKEGVVGQQVDNIRWLEMWSFVFFDFETLSLNFVHFSSIFGFFGGSTVGVAPFGLTLRGCESGQRQERDFHGRRLGGLPVDRCLWALAFVAYKTAGWRLKAFLAILMIDRLICLICLVVCFGSVLVLFGLISSRFLASTRVCWFAGIFMHSREGQRLPDLELFGCQIQGETNLSP